MAPIELTPRVGDAQLEAFEKKRTNSRANTALAASLNTATPAPLVSIKEGSTQGSSGPLVPPPTQLFPNPAACPAPTLLRATPISPVSPAPATADPVPDTAPPATSAAPKVKEVPVALPEPVVRIETHPTALARDTSSITSNAPLQPLVSSQPTASIGSMLLMNGQQKVHLIETQFRLLTQSFKEKVAQPLFGTETQVTRFQDAEEADAAIEKLQDFYTKLHEHINSYHRSLQQVVECESEMARMMLESGYKSLAESEIGNALVACGTAFQTESNSLAGYVRAVSGLRDQLRVFLQHALRDAQDTRRKQEDARREWDAAHLKLLPNVLRIPHHHDATAARGPVDPEKPDTERLNQKLTDLTTGFVKKCAVLQHKSAADLTQQLWALRKHAALHHSNGLDCMMSNGTQ